MKKNQFPLQVHESFQSKVLKQCLKLCILLTFFVFLAGHHLQAQEKSLYPDFIITTEKDTIPVRIVDKDDAALSSRVEFQQQGSDEMITKTPAEIDGFGFGYGRFFKSIETDSDPVFAKRLLTGKLNMYIRRTESQKEYDVFLLGSDSNFVVKLDNPKKHTKKDAGQTVTLADNRYLGQLAWITGTQVSDKELAKLKFREKQLKKYINSYNRKFEDDYPTGVYQEQVDKSINISAGYPLFQGDKEFGIRGAVYLDKTFPEKSRQLKIRRGISYQYWIVDDKYLESYKESSKNIRWQSISVLPFGVYFQGKKENFKLYAYAVFGVTVIITKDLVIGKHLKAGYQTDYLPLPTVNTGIGCKVKVGQNYLNLELTPALSGAFINLGFSF